MNQPVDDRAARDEYYHRIASKQLTPLWESLSALVPEQPRSPCVPYLWRYDDLRSWLLEAGRLITAREAVRRVLILENPGMPGSSSITQALYAGLQLILPGEVAPSHRHTQTALRLIVEGAGAYTAVDGERVSMSPGDFIITPAWTWHDHGSESDDPVVWLDGLDIPLVRFLDCGFAENNAQETPAVTKPDGDALARYGANLLPVDFVASHSASPVFTYPYERSRAALALLTRGEAPDPWHGHRLQFINPASGGPAMPTLGAFIQLLPRAFESRGYRSTDGMVFHVIEGHGTCVIGDQRIEFGPRDTFVVPAWTSHRFNASEDAVLFSFSDRPVQRALSLWREQRLG